MQSTTHLTNLQLKQYDYCLSTKPLANPQIHLISTFPNTQEILDLQHTLQGIQENRTIFIREELPPTSSYDLQAYLSASSHLLSHFDLLILDNPTDFESTVAQIVEQINVVSDKSYLTEKLLARFQVSPLAIPHTNLVLLHTQSSKIKESRFSVVELGQSVPALSMNHQVEDVQRILVMLTGLDEKDEVRELMTAISQSIIENKLYTEIYRTGNRDILYHLLNTIFTD